MNKIKNLKTAFRKKANKYFINDNKELLYKNKIKCKVNNKIITKIENFKVPTLKVLNNLLYVYHTKTCHANYKELKNYFYADKICFKGLDYLVQEYINNCPVCVQTSLTIYRLNPIHPIIVNGPDIRYEFNITYINEDM